VSDEQPVVEKDAFLREDILAAREVEETRIRKELLMETEAERAKRLWIESNKARNLGSTVN